MEFAAVIRPAVSQYQ